MATYAHLLEVVGRNIQAVRTAQGMKQTTLGAAIGRSQTTISRIEHGRYALSLRRVYLLARALGVPVARLFVEPPG
jgi:transcriptional regulator with XRE-family HTH domain